jgi:phage-related holin
MTSKTFNFSMKATLITFLKYFGVALFSFFAPIFYAFILVSILVVTDTITGVMRAGRKDVEAISSKKMFAIVPKLIFYFLLVIVAHGITLVEPQLPFVKFALIGVSFIEIKSIDENFKGLFGFSFLDKTFKAIKQINQIKRHKDDN